MAGKRSKVGKRMRGKKIGAAQTKTFRKRIGGLGKLFTFIYGCQRKWKIESC